MRAVTLRCDACGLEAGPLAALPRPFRCPRADADGGDHVLAPALVDSSVAWPPRGDEHPFLRYAPLLFVHQAALELGLGEPGYREATLALDEAVQRVDGRGVRVTPCERSAALSELAGCEVWVKDETRGVSGSHKARHLFGVALFLSLARRAGLESERPRLAIASCGNAALAAAVMARASQLALDTFVPPDAAASVLARLEALGASVHVCERQSGALGDPCVAAFRAAVAAGAVPFGCQGPDNGLALDGGRTLAFEVVDHARAVGRIDRVFVQVGGGALASSLARGLSEAHALGALAHVPRIHPVQSERVAPLSAGYARLLGALGPGGPPADGDRRADWLRAVDVRGAVQAELARGRAERASLLRPWPQPATSVAHGILDDDTYDGLAVLQGTLDSGGTPVVVDEATLIEAASALASATGIAADETGSAGLAGLLAWRRSQGLSAGERVLVLATGARR